MKPFRFQSFLIILFFPIFLFAQEREKMIIVSYFSFVPQMFVYVEKKAKDNIDCKLISVNSTDNFNSIKAKIDNVYKSFNANFLLLVGDNEHIPSYKIEEGLSDIHYAFEDENSPNPRMSVGRFSVETYQDLQTMIDRSLNRKFFSKHAVGIASYHKSELTEKTDYEQLQFIGQHLQSKGFAKISELFSGLSGNNPTYQDVIKTLQLGATWLNYIGNGSYEGWNTTEFTNQHIDCLTDNVELPIILSASCLGGHFANRTCFAEKWLRSTKNKNPVGAVAAIMSSNLTDWDATLSAMLIISENMPPTNSNCRLGNLYLQGYHHILDSMQRKKDAQCWILFGDPSLWIYPQENTLFENNFPNTSYRTIYPNPTTGQLTIDNGELTIENIEIFDVVGRKLQSKIVNLKSEIEIDVSNLSAGTYILKIKKDKGTVTKKFIKE